jgi:hypothetical protein
MDVHVQCTEFPLPFVMFGLILSPSWRTICSDMFRKIFLHRVRFARHGLIHTPFYFMSDGVICQLQSSSGVPLVRLRRVHTFFLVTTSERRSQVNTFS